jgi:hypothetical protein
MPVDGAWACIVLGVWFMSAMTILYRPLWAVNHWCYRTNYFRLRFERSPTLRMILRFALWTERKGFGQYLIRAIYVSIGLAAILAGLSGLGVLKI